MEPGTLGRRKRRGRRRRRKDREDGVEEEEEKEEEAEEERGKEEEEQAEEEEVLCGFPGFRHVSFSLSEVWISRSVRPIDQLETHSDIDRESRVGVQSVEVRSHFGLKFTLEMAESWGQVPVSHPSPPSTPPSPPPTTRSPQGGRPHHKHHLDDSTHATRRQRPAETEDETERERESEGERGMEDGGKQMEERVGQRGFFLKRKEEGRDRKCDVAGVTGGQRSSCDRTNQTETVSCHSRILLPTPPLPFPFKGP